MRIKSFTIKVCGIVLFTALGLTGLNAQRMLQRVNQASPARNVEFDVFLPGENPDQLDKLIEAQHTKGSPNYRKWLTPQEFQTQFGPNPATLSKVSADLSARGFTVESVHGHGLHVTGTVNSVQRAFGVTLWNAATASGQRKLVGDRALRLPFALSRAGAFIPAFSSVPPRHTHSHVLANPDNRTGAVGPYWFTDIKQAYQFPSYRAFTGFGRTIAIVMSSDVLDSDLDLYFGHENLPTPQLIRIPVHGGSGPADHIERRHLRSVSRHSTVWRHGPGSENRTLQYPRLKR